MADKREGVRLSLDSLSRHQHQARTSRQGDGHRGGRYSQGGARPAGDCGCSQEGGAPDSGHLMRMGGV